MPFVFNVGFPTEHDRNDFVSKVVPKVRASETEPVPVEGREEDGLFRVGLAVTSQSAAKDVCNQIVAFLAHSKNSRVTLSWKGTDGQAQVGDINAGAASDADIVGRRLGAAAKAHMDGEKAGATGA